MDYDRSDFGYMLEMDVNIFFSGDLLCFFILEVIEGLYCMCLLR